VRSAFSSSPASKRLVSAVACATYAADRSQLYEYPAEMVRLFCDKCARSGQYRKQTLIERFGPDIRLPDLREEEEIAQCERHGKMHDACMVHYVERIVTR
jgi:hypothetical protein